VRLPGWVWGLTVRCARQPGRCQLAGSSPRGLHMTRTRTADGLAYLSDMNGIDNVATDRIPGQVRGRDLQLWRATLESLWKQKLDQAIVLARACAEVGVAPWESAGRSAPPYERLQSRTERAYADLGDIEAAIGRVDAGTYGICAGCGHSMADEWLADQPDVQRCRDCLSGRAPAPSADSTAPARSGSPRRLMPAQRSRAGRQRAARVKVPVG
jgi:RNA polymerase-binding transcription factor DksA